MKYESYLERKERYGFGEVCTVVIKCDDWELYERLVKIVEKELEDD